MNYKKSISLVKYLAERWKMNDSLSLEILKILHADYLSENEQTRGFINEFSFISGKGCEVDRKIRILNLLFPKMMDVPDIKMIKKSRLDSIICILEKLLQERVILPDMNKIKDLLKFVSKNPDWLLQFGMEQIDNGRLRIKIYFGRTNREKEELNFMVELVGKIGRILNARYKKLAIFPILENNIDALSLDITENGHSLKIYDYCHFPEKKHMDHIIKKHSLINCIRKDSLFDYFRELIGKYEIYGQRNFDTMMTYRFENNSLDLKETKINIHLNPHMDAKKILKGIVRKSDKYILDYFKKNMLEISFIGNQPDEFFFYVR
jgi:hypothetical protein